MLSCLVAAACVGDAAPSAAPAALPWTPVATVAFGADDVSAPFTLHPRGAVTFVRVTGVPLADTCMQLQSLTAPDGTSLVAANNSGPYCTRCRWRVATAIGSGVFALPTDGAFPTLEARLRLLDCDVLLESVSPGRRRASARVEALDGAVVVHGTFDVALAYTPSAAITADDAFLVAGLPAHVVDTTGAGDCFCGVLAAALSEGADLRSAMTASNAAAGLSTETAGAAPSMPARAAVEARLTANRLGDSNGYSWK